MSPQDDGRVGFPTQLDCPRSGKGPAFLITSRVWDLVRPGGVNWGTWGRGRCGVVAVRVAMRCFFLSQDLLLLSESEWSCHHYPSSSALSPHFAQGHTGLGINAPAAVCQDSAPCFQLEPHRAVPLLSQPLPPVPLYCRAEGSSWPHLIVLALWFRTGTMISLV